MEKGKERFLKEAEKIKEFAKKDIIMPQKEIDRIKKSAKRDLERISKDWKISPFQFI